MVVLRGRIVGRNEGVSVGVLVLGLVTGVALGFVSLTALGAAPATPVPRLQDVVSTGMYWDRPNQATRAAVADGHRREIACRCWRPAFI